MGKRKNIKGGAGQFWKLYKAKGISGNVVKNSKNIQQFL